MKRGNYKEQDKLHLDMMVRNRWVKNPRGFGAADYPPPGFVNTYLPR
jgi:hypothetical protein